MNTLNELKKIISGEILTDFATRIRYSTDASVYKEMPLGVAFPKDDEDISKLVRFANDHQLALIPRAAGTSLAGQVVGNGLVVDTSRYMNKILSINLKEEYAIVQPGVVRDELNMALAKEGYFFAPETATSNRCCIGGMCGNNSCGANSLVYGSTRHHILALDTVLSDGSQIRFSDLTQEQFKNKCAQQDFEGKIYQSIYQLLEDKSTQEEIRKGFPDKKIRRRSMGYAIDELIEMQPFVDEKDKQSAPLFNFCSLLVGSEGTLAFTTKIKVKITPLPYPHKKLLTLEFRKIEDALEANIQILPFKPFAIELIDKTILDLAKQNITQNKNRFFLKGDPEAILVVEIIEENEQAIDQKIEAVCQLLNKQELIDNHCVVSGKDMARVWALRKAGLGIMSNVKGDSKPVTVVEDIAISPEKYPAYFKEFKALLEKYDLHCAYYAHISTGELHNKPLFNLKDKNEVLKFRKFAGDAALLVKKYGGSLSGEHGDGRLRGEFLPIMVGEFNYQLFIQVKNIFDPNHLLNIGKIVNTPAMNASLRYDAENIDERKYHLETIFDFSDTDGILRAIEKCNGSGDCKKSHKFGASMCPSFMATRDEKNSTRGRANILREMITHSQRDNSFNHKEIYDALDLCLACKACKSECPSNVDITKIRAEFLYHYYQQHPLPLRSWIIANYPYFNKWCMPISGLYNFICTNQFISFLFKKTIGFATERSLPTLAKCSLTRWAKKNLRKPENPIRCVYFFNDEFTNTNDVSIGIAAIELLQKLGYEVRLLPNQFSGRTYLSKGRLKKAKKIAHYNIHLFAPIIDDKTPLIGIEPSGILSFRDEYLDLCDEQYKESAKKLAKNCFLIDEFIAHEFENQHIKSSSFTKEPAEILFHAHCYQKALSDSNTSIKMMQIPENYKVKEIKDCCCGMAGAFGYEKNHFELSMEVGNLTLFPAVKEAEDSVMIAATGTSCRHQIKDGTQRKALHPVEILRSALIEAPQK